ncbi:hypothetical protein J6590_036107 [Homalodisca vitripennis]|nr:hypothetical protein J6590_036107 [Homalodisca vitripennis]
MKVKKNRTGVPSEFTFGEHFRHFSIAKSHYYLFAGYHRLHQMLKMGLCFTAILLLERTDLNALETSSRSGTTSHVLHRASDYISIKEHLTLAFEDHALFIAQLHHKQCLGNSPRSRPRTDEYTTGECRTLKQLYTGELAITRDTMRCQARHDEPRGLYTHRTNTSQPGNPRAAAEQSRFLELHEKGQGQDNLRNFQGFEGDHCHLTEFYVDDHDDMCS